ncbi:hypothetical protein VTO42DRAFT_3859 [Malbranchea cinnamomea]
METEGRVLRPRPRKTFEFNLPTTESSGPPTPSTEDAPLNLDVSSSKNSNNKDGLSSASRSQSILNLTSPTLLGIYSPTALDTPRDEIAVSNTPWGTGAQTPNPRVNGTIPEEGEGGGTAAAAAAALRSRTRRHHAPRKHGFKGFVLPLIKRSVLLFIFGMAYGLIITHLHDDLRLPVTLSNVFDLSSWQYMALWGAAGVGLGSLLPWFDGLWEDMSSRGKLQDVRSTLTRSTSSLAADWNPMVRGFGAFVGIAFAIRRLPWQSTLQVSLTLSLANPVLWYLVDRSKPGFILSTIVGLMGMLAVLNINPDIVPSPAAVNPSSIPVDDASNPHTGTLHNSISQENLIVGMWIASVLFCSCVCFGNIGRRLAS